MTARRLLLLVLLAQALPAVAQPAPALRLALAGEPRSALLDPDAVCTPPDTPDAPARGIRLSPTEVQLYATDQIGRVDRGPDLDHLRHDCAIVLRGGGHDDPGEYDDHVWITAPWTDGRIIWAIVHDEFHGHTRPALCPSGRYMDCWYNALTLAVSDDGGRSFHRSPGAALVAALPYRFDQLPLGHHGYFNPSNVVSRDGNLFMFAFVTSANLQGGGNCLLRTATIADAASWRAWNGRAFGVALPSPYAAPLDPAAHLCSPVALSSLRWPVTSLVRHGRTFIALMQKASRDGGIYYATSPDLLHWSEPALLVSIGGLGAWVCGDEQPIAYPSLLDPASPDRNFETVGDHAVLFATRFEGLGCRVASARRLIRWDVVITEPPQ